jgi:hypothetical protein
MKKVNYKQGQTAVWSDGEKLVITNPSGKTHIEANVDRIFGMGEFKKMASVQYSESIERGRINPLAKFIEISTGYIPERVKKDLAAQSLPGLTSEDFKV